MAVLPQITSKIFLYLLLCSAILATAFQGASCETEPEGPSESECRPYIEKALKKLETGDTPEVAQEDVNLEVTENEDDSNSSPIGDVIETDDNEAALNLDQEQADQPESTQEDTESLETESEPTKSLEEDTVDEQTETEKSEEQQISKECDSETGCATETKTSSEEEQVTESVSNETETAEEVQASAEATQETEASVEQNASAEEVVEQAESTEAQTEAIEAPTSVEQEVSSTETASASQEDAIEQEQSDSDRQVSTENDSATEQTSAEDTVVSEQDNASVEDAATGEISQEETPDNASVQESAENTAEQTEDSVQSAEQSEEAAQSVEQVEETLEAQSVEQTEETAEAQSVEQNEESAQSVEQVEEAAEQTEESTQSVETQSVEQTEETTETQSVEQNEATAQSLEQTEETAQSSEDSTASVEQTEEAAQSVEQTDEAAKSVEQTEDAASSVEQTDDESIRSAEQIEAAQSVEQTEEVAPSAEESETQSESTEVQSEEKPIVIEDLTFEFDIPTNLRPRAHVTEILQINEASDESELINIKAEDTTLKELKRLYENAIKPLEVLYKYRDLSNRHFGDPEIYSKPLVLFMGPWSGGKSSIINYLLDNEYSDTSLRTGAEPSPAYFNIITHGEKAEVLDGTQLAADWTFSGLQKFGQGLEERLRGLKMPKKLLEKINIVEIPGILEVRKQVSRIFPFNDVCQWFIDRADIIFLVYDPSKLDVGPETEAILDQLKGREYQTRIILNKADQVKPEELMRVQGALIWNISPLMSSAQPPVMYSTSLWSRPYEIGAPIRLLEAQERAFLRDLKNAMDRRVENKIASARRFAVRVRNHAKMVDCYLTTYYNHKSVFGNRKLVSDQIIEHPQEYHIYEGLSTLTNISRYDLPDPDVYRDFFKLNPLYDFQQLSATCTYFRGCPINRLDIAIAYDLPELVGKYKKMTENTLDSVKATLKS